MSYYTQKHSEFIKKNFLKNLLELRSKDRLIKKFVVLVVLTKVMFYPPKKNI